MQADIDPPRALAEEPLYRKIGWTPHEAQLKIIRAASVRNRVVAGGRRIGKSDVGGHRLFKEAMDTRLVAAQLKKIQKRREFWIIGPEYTDSEKEFRVVYNELTKAGAADYFDRPGTYNDPLGGSMHISMYGGTFMIHAKSAKHPETLVGEGLRGVIMAEAAKLKEKVWTKFARPMLADYSGWALFSSTPEGKNWFYDLWRRGQDPSRPDWWSIRAPSWVNPYVYPAGATDQAIDLLRVALAGGASLTDDLCLALRVDPEIGALVGDLTEETFKQEIAADFTEFAGRVFKNFDEEIHVSDLAYNPGWQTYAAVDYGFTNPSVWLLIQVDPFGEQVHVLNEVYESGLTADEFALEIKRRGLCPPSLLRFYPDPASPGDTRILEQHLKVKGVGGTGGEKRFRIDAIRAALKIAKPQLPEDHPERIPALIFDRKCQRTIADFLNYRYAERVGQQDRNTPEDPMKKDDHGPEALGRFYAGHFGTPDRTARRARVRRASVSA